MNTKIYKRVLSLTDSLLSAVQQKNQKRFDGFYLELKQLCQEHENTDKDHPVQWETLGDFTDDLPLAITIYQQALKKAEAINSKDFCSSIGYSIAALKVELDDKTGAIEYLEKAKISCNKIVDKELKAEIHDLLEELKRSVAQTSPAVEASPKVEANAEVEHSTETKASPVNPYAASPYQDN